MDVSPSTTCAPLWRVRGFWNRARAIPTRRYTEHGNEKDGREDGEEARGGQEGRRRCEAKKESGDESHRSSRTRARDPRGHRVRFERRKWTTGQLDARHRRVARQNENHREVSRSRVSRSRDGRSHHGTAGGKARRGRAK